MSERTTVRDRRRRARRLLLPIMAALLALVLVPGPASAATAAPPASFTDQINGVEYGFTSTEGRFAGVATGPRSGLFDAVVVHDPLNPGTTPTPITRGTFVIKSSPTVSGTITGGTITRTVLGTPGCRNEIFDVKGTLGGSSSGRFQVTLTHYQRTIAGACRTYFATVAGSVTIGSVASGA